MFTGIIEEIGEVVEIKEAGDFRAIHVRGKTVCDDLKIGSSIAVNGVCLTVRSIATNVFTAEMSRETLDRTSLGNLARGSIAVDGISLTVADLQGSSVFSVAIIPHTFENTNLKMSKTGDPVNLEFDVIAKYVETLIKPYAVRND